jgi:hypothetical protein
MEDVCARGEALKYVASEQAVIVGPADSPDRYVSTVLACDPSIEDEEFPPE